MSRHILFLLVLTTFSCNRKVELTNQEIYIAGGIKDGLRIFKLEQTDSKYYPHFPTTKEMVILKFNDSDVITRYESGNTVYLRKGKPYEHTEKISLINKNENYYWVFEVPSDTTKYDVFPLKLEKDHWYLINHFSMSGSESYIQFYINEHGIIEQGNLEYVHLSPI